MRFENRMTFLLVALLAGGLGCDWIPGSTLSWSQSVRTWEVLSSGSCLTLGTYEFALDSTLGAYQGKSSVQMQTDNKDDQEFLPPFFDVNWYLNDSLTPFYSQEFELKKGKGSLREFQPNVWNYEVGDTIRYEICAGGGGSIPIFTRIDFSASYKFDKINPM